VKWVVFDAVGTLMYPCPGVPLAYHEIGRRYGSRLSEKVVRERLSVAFGSVVRPRGDRTSADDEQAWWRRVVAATLTDVNDPAATFDSPPCFGGDRDATRPRQSCAKRSWCPLYTPV